MSTDKEAKENGNLPIYGVISRALVDAIKEESDYNYDQHGSSWQWALNEMSDEVNEVWREKMNKIYKLSCQLDDKLKEHGL